MGASKNNNNQEKKILVADPDLYYYECFNDDPDKGKVSFEFVDSGAKAQTHIKENRDAYAAIFVSPELRNPDGYSVIKCALQYQPVVPVYFIESLRTELNIDLDESKLAIAGTFAKPFKISDIIKKLGPALRVLDVESMLAVAKKNNDELNKELEDTDPNFRPIAAELFISGSQSLFDVYVKLRANKYIKILQAGDNFDYERVMEYLKKGVTHFFIRKEALEAYVTYCDKLTSAISTSSSISLDKKFGFVLNQAEVTLNTMVDLGVDSDSIAYAQKYLKNVCHMIDSYAKQSNFLSGLLKELGKFEHAGGVVLVASIVARNAGIETEKGLQTLGLASFLHDVGLIYKSDDDDMYKDNEEKYYDEGQIVQKLESKKIYGDEKSLYEMLWHQHAERGARMIENEEGIPSLVPQIIRQHHSQRDKREGRAKGGSVHPMAEILEISDEFVRLMHKFEESNETSNRELLFSRLLQIVSDFPRRTREPFLDAFGFTKKAA